MCNFSQKVPKFHRQVGMRPYMQTNTLHRIHFQRFTNVVNITASNQNKKEAISNKAKGRSNGSARQMMKNKCSFIIKDCEDTDKLVFSNQKRRFFTIN